MARVYSWDGIVPVIDPAAFVDRAEALADQVFDYAGRRPPIVFDRDHFARYDAPQLSLHLLTDTDGRDFLLLRGPEPALQWERMSAAVRYVVEQLDVQRTVVVQTMPSPSPHTRPVAITRYASDDLTVSFALGLVTAREETGYEAAVGELQDLPFAELAQDPGGRALLEASVAENIVSEES